VRPRPPPGMGQPPERGRHPKDRSQEDKMASGILPRACRRSRPVRVGSKVGARCVGGRLRCRPWFVLSARHPAAGAPWRSESLVTIVSGRQILHKPAGCSRRFPGSSALAPLACRKRRKEGACPAKRSRNPRKNRQ
jgi:hypothetical protein